MNERSKLEADKRQQVECRDDVQRRETSTKKKILSKLLTVSNYCDRDLEKEGIYTITNNEDITDKTDIRSTKF